MMSSIRRKIVQAGDKPGALIKLTEEEMEYLKNEMKQCPADINSTEIKDRHREQLTSKEPKLKVSHLKKLAILAGRGVGKERTALLILNTLCSEPDFHGDKLQQKAFAFFKLTMYPLTPSKMQYFKNKIIRSQKIDWYGF